MEEFLTGLSADLDAYLEGTEGRAQSISDDVLARMTADELRDADLAFWAIAVLIALEGEFRRLKRFLANRGRKLADEFGEERLSYAFSRRAEQMAKANAEVAAASIHAKTREAIIAGLRGRDLADGLRATIEQEMVDFMRSLDTVVSMFDRIAIRSIGEMAGDLWIYAGPADNRNRAFCRDIVRRKSAFTPSGIDKLNSHPDLHKYVPPNVSVLCGGYGCRHVWWPVSRQYVERNQLEVEE